MGEGLKKAFWWAAKGATIGLGIAVGWQIFLDPLFFGPIHNVDNLTVQAWVGMMNDWFGWIPNLVGFTGDSGFLHTDFMQNFMEPYLSDVKMIHDTAPDLTGYMP